MQIMLLLLLVSASVQGAPVLETRGKEVDRLGEVPIFAEAVTHTGKPLVLGLTGAGIRQKGFAFIQLDVYALASYVDKPSALDPNSPLPGLAKSAGRALQLTFLREVSGKKVHSAFAASLEANGVAVEGEMLRLVDTISVTFPERGQLNLVGISAEPGKQILTAEYPGGTVTVQSPSLVDDFWKIWFGKPSDGGIEDLKAALVSRLGTAP